MIDGGDDDDDDDVSGTGNGLSNMLRPRLV